MSYQPSAKLREVQPINFLIITYSIIGLKLRLSSVRGAQQEKGFQVIETLFLFGDSQTFRNK